jgi:uncharacterized membrane protein
MKSEINRTPADQAGIRVMWFLFSVFVMVQVISWLTPPFQSPDEFNHFKRAYLLSRGSFLLKEMNLETGGMVDEGLLDYMNCFSKIPFDYAQKGDGAIPSKCRDVHFSGTDRFSRLPNTAFYFPVTYAPQAFAVVIGRYTALSVAETYYLARNFALLVTLALMWWAFMFHPPPPPCMALFVLPMSMFQFASASMDAVTFALTAFAAALFIRGMDRARTFDTYMHCSLAGAILLLATSRIAYVSLIIFLLIIYWRRRSWQFLASSFLVSIASMTWILLALKYVHGQAAAAISSTQIAEYYSHNPLSLAAVFWRTLTNADLLMFYWSSFVGILGWLDTPLDSWVYLSTTALLLALAAVSIVMSRIPRCGDCSVALAAASVISVILIFFLALVGWNPHPAVVIGGIQGRYFYPPAILLAYAGPQRLDSSGRRISWCIVALIAIASITDVVQKLLLRYG